MPNPDIARIAERIFNAHGATKSDFLVDCEQILAEELAALTEYAERLRGALETVRDVPVDEESGGLLITPKAMTAIINAISSTPADFVEIAKAKRRVNGMTALEQFSCDEANRLYNEAIMEGTVHLSRLFDSLVAAGIKGREEERHRLEWFMAEEGRTWSRRGDTCPGEPFVVWNADRTQAGQGYSVISAIDDALQSAQGREGVKG